MNSIKRNSEKISNWKFGDKNLNKSNKNSVEIFTNRLDQVEDRLSGLEDQVYELELT
jgi:hypothetical protein